MMKNKYKVMITSCWVLLIICFVLKIFGANWFEPVLTDGNFVEFCNWLDNNWAKYIFSSIVYVPSSYLVYLCLTKQKLGKDLWLIILLIVSSILKWNFVIISTVIELSTMILIPLIKGKFKNILWVLIGNLLIILLQLVSLFTRTLGFNLSSDSMLIGFIMQIDYYIMIILYYLYINKRREE